MVVSLLSMGALNDALYASETGRLTIYDGLMTVGGLMPVSDAATYLAGMQTFIHYGELNNWSLFKPISILWAAVVYDMCGEDMVLFLRFCVLAYAGSAVYLGVICRRHVGSLFSLMLTWGVSLYFIYFHGTFLTENFSAPFALLAIALLLDGWQSKGHRSFLAGIALLSLAMVMRPGAMFFLPLLMLASGFHFAGIRKYSWRMPLMTGLVYVLVVGLSLLQPRLLKNPYRQVSNAAGQLYQIHTNAPSWSVYKSLPFPDSLKILPDIADAKSRFVSNEIRKEPMKFVRNYLSMIIRAFPRPETWIFSFAYHLPNWFKWGFLTLFLLTPWIRDRKDPVQALFLLLCLNLIGSLLSIPVMEEIRTRLMMVTMPLHIMVCVLGLINGSYLLLRIISSHSIRLMTGSSTDTVFSTPFQRRSAWMIILIPLVIFAPVTLDQVRKIDVPDIPPDLPDRFQSYKTILPDMRTTPMALFDMGRQFSVADPLIIPRSKFLMNLTDSSIRLNGRFYLANAVSCVKSSIKRSEIHLLLMPDSLLSHQKITLPRYMLFRVRKVQFKQQMEGLYIADSVLWTQ